MQGKLIHKTSNVVNLSTEINASKYDSILKPEAKHNPPKSISKLPDIMYSKASLLLQQERMSKGGVIGTNGKGVVTLRFDDYRMYLAKKYIHY